MHFLWRTEPLAGYYALLCAVHGRQDAPISGAMIAMLRIRFPALDERRVRHIRRWWYDRCDDLGEFMAVFIGLVLALGVIVLLWLAAVQVEQYIKPSIR